MKRFYKTQPRPIFALIASLGGACLSGMPQHGMAAAGELEEIVVTVRRTEETAQSVPVSVTAISGQTLADTRIDNGAALQKLAPSLSVYSLSRDEETFALRGLSSANTSSQGQAPSVMTYFAQVPLPPGDGGGPGRYFDLQNVQVLKGPQGTLFGRNSTGGAVLFEPQRPTEKTEGYLKAQIGNYADRELEGAANLPLVTDKLTVRLAGSIARRDGFTKNITNGDDLDNRNYRSGRVSVLLTPNDHLENLLVGDYFHSATHGSSNVLLGINNASALAFFFPQSALNDAVAQQNALGIRKVALSQDTGNTITAWGISNSTQWAINDNLTLKNILGYRRYKQFLRNDNDASNLVILDARTRSGPTNSREQWTEELQLQGTALDDSLDWTLGIFGLTARAPDTQHAEYTVFRSIASVNTTEPKETSWSPYGQLTYDLSPWIDGLKVNAGYRYTKDHRELKQSARSNGNCSLDAGDPSVNFSNCELSLSRNYGSGSYTIGTDYQLTPDALLYLTHRKGYRSGGLNTQGAAVGRSVFGPEHVSDIEAGIKADWHFYAGVSARTNIAVFRTKRDDAQISQAFTAVVNGTTQSLNLIVNEAAATIKGLEFDGLVSFPFGLNLSAAWAYTEATYDSYLDITKTPNQALKNQPYPFTPRNKVSLGARYQVPISDGFGDLSAAINWSRSSAIKFNVAPDPFGDQAAYAQTDLFLNWTDAMQAPIDISLFVTNLTDTKYKIGGFPVYYSVGFSSGVYNEPRMFGISAKYRFGADR